MAKTLTETDKKCLDLIRQCGGFVTIVDCQPHLETYTQISNYRLDRLIALGLLTPSDDALFDGVPPQTYRIKEDTDVCIKQKSDSERPDPEG